MWKRCRTGTRCGTETMRTKMGGISLDLQAFAQGAAGLTGRARAGVAGAAKASHLAGKSLAGSTAAACSENRYPSPPARPVCPPHGPRRFSVQLPKSCKAPSLQWRIFRYEMHNRWGKIPAYATTSRAETCVNLSSFWPSCPSPHSLAACKPTVSVRSQAPQLAQSWPMQPTTARSLARRSVHWLALIATTRVCAADSTTLTPVARQPRAGQSLCDNRMKSSPGQPARGAFFVTETVVPTCGDRFASGWRGAGRI